jgi:uncharacterized membrane protein
MWRSTLLLIHLLAAMAWVGGMFFAHFCLRPAAVQTLTPPQRLPLMRAALSHFLRALAIAVPLVLLSGLALLSTVRMAHAPWGWHAMLASGSVMAGIYAVIHLRLLPRLRAHCDAGDWPAAAQVLNSIRRLVALNLGLGILTVAAAILGR